MNSTKQLAKMIQYAAHFHSEQTDLQGRPYFEHVYQVMQNLDPDADDELKAIAIGHDLIEDTSVNERYLREHVFSDRVVDGILAMTKTPGMPYNVYLAQVMENPDAVRVKMADLKHNMDPTRLRGVGEKDQARMVKYMKAYHDLKEALQAWEEDNEV